MKNKFLALVLVSTMLASGGIAVYAEEGNTQTITADDPSASTFTSFNISADMLEGGELVVSIPASMTLEYSQANDNYSNTSVVKVTGNIDPSKKVVVSTPTNITYANEKKSSVKANGVVAFGVTDGDNQKMEYSAEELMNAKTTGISKDISSSVAKSNVEYAGTYSTNIVFDISLADAE